MSEVHLTVIALLLWCLLLTECAGIGTDDIHYELVKMSADTQAMRNDLERIRRDVDTLNDKVEYR